MKTQTVLAIAAVAATLSSLARAHTHDTYPILRTLDGHTYTNVEVSSVSASSLTVFFDGGGAAIPFTNLPLGFQKKYHYDPAKLDVREVAGGYGWTLGARFPENLRVETNDYAGGISYDFSQDQAHPVEGWLILTENRRIASIDYCIQSKLQDEVCRVLKKKYGLRGTNNYGDDGYYVHFGTTNRQAVLRVTEWAHERDGHVYLEYRDEKLCQITESERRSRRIAAGEAPYLPEKPQESTTKSLTEQADDKVRAMREEFEARQRLADLSGQTSSEVKAAKKEEAWKEAALYEAAANRAQKVAWEAEKVAVEFEKEMRPVAEADKRKVDLATHEADVAAKVIADAQHETIFQLYSRRAATGDGYAQWRLGEMYLNGEGTETNLTLARKWLATAGTNWYAHATKELHTLQSSP